MEFPCFGYDPTFQCFPHDAPEYHEQLFTDEFDTTGLIDVLSVPEYDASAGPPYPCGRPSMQRFLKDTQRASFFNPIPQSHYPGVAQPLTTGPLKASHGRHGSPFSSNEPSSCHSARSPHADNELGTDNTPSTTSDGALFSPYSSAPYESFDSECQLPLCGAGDMPGDNHQYGSLGEANMTLNGEPQAGWEDSGHAVDFESPQRSFAYESQTLNPSEAAIAVTQPPATPDCHGSTFSKATSSVTQGEIQIPDRSLLVGKATDAYLSPSTRESEDILEEIDVASPQSEDDEEDDDYQPGKKQFASTSRRAHKLKRGAGKSARDKAGLKRARTTPSTRPLKILPPPVNRSQSCFPCSACSHSFKDECTLHSHIKKKHTRPFTCVFRFAGCDSTFVSKNEWKRHVMSQHLLLHYWLCDIGDCAHHKNDQAAPCSRGGKRSKGRRAENTPFSGPTGPPLPNGAIFNRKDLYTQHLRRMHTPPHIKKSGSAKSTKKVMISPQASLRTNSTEWDDRIKTFQRQALRERCQLPTYMECPAPHCSQAFTGADAWDQRMEHVARHLEKAAVGVEKPVVFGGPADPSLMAWVAKPDVAVARLEVPGGAWVLNNPLRSADESRIIGKKRSLILYASSSPVVVTALSPTIPSVNGETVVEEDEDAEGEEE